MRAKRLTRGKRRKTAAPRNRVTQCSRAACAGLLALTVLTLLSPRARAESLEAEWAIDEGWLTVSVEDVSVLSSAPGCPIEVKVDDKAFPPKGTAPASVEGSAANGFRVTYAAQGGRLVDAWKPFDALGPEAWLRTITYANTSSAPQDLTHAVLRVHPAMAQEGDAWNPRHFWMAPFGPQGAVCISYRGGADLYRLAVNGEGLPCHGVSACWRLAPGQKATIGEQGIWLSPRGREGFRDEVQRWYRAIGLSVPPTPPWLRNAVLYELNAGGHVESRFSDVGGFDALAQQVDYLAGLGITAVWLQGVHSHKTSPNPVEGGWNLYAPRDFSKVDAILGGAEALKRLTEAFRERGIHVIGEIVPHGGNSVQATALRDWWTARRDGTPQRNWGGCGMDYASPPWQEVMGGAVAMLARDFGMEGVRIDVAEGSGSNWTSPRTNHASYSTLGGSVEMLQAIHDGLRAGGVQEPVLIPENWNNPEHFALSPVGYGHKLWMFLARDIPGMMREPSSARDALRDFFELERGAYPEGAMLLRYLDNHDTVCEAGRVQLCHGYGPARALYAICLMVPGIPMLYQEEETGSFEALRRMNLARRAIPEFTSEEADYFAVDFAPEVFACLRPADDGGALGLSNLSGEEVQGLVMLRGAKRFADGTRVYDGVSGREAFITDGAFPWTLGPYAVALMRIGRPPLDLAPPRARAAATVGAETPSIAIQSTERGVEIEAGGLRAALALGPGPWEDKAASPGRVEKTSPDGSLAVTRTSDSTIQVEMHFTEGEQKSLPEITVHNAARWLVSGQSALLEDRVLRKHFPFPDEAGYVWKRTMVWGRGPHQGLYNGVAPCGRLWQSVLEPLHPAQPAVAFLRGGSGILIQDIESEAGNIVLTDRTDEPAVESLPYALALRFHGRDRDLSPRIRALGLGQPWTMDVYPKGPSSPQALRFTLHAMSEEELRARLDAGRGPLARGNAIMGHQGGRFLENPHGSWFIEPGTLTWMNLSPVPGTHRIRLELRHSEVSAEGMDLGKAYEVTLDGQSLPLEWVKQNTFNTGNAYFGYAVTPPVDLSEGRHTLAITTDHAWCAIRKGFHLLPGEDGAKE